MATTSTLHDAVLKNVAADSISTGLAVANVIVAEAERRPDLKGKIQSVQYDRTRGIGVLVVGEGDRQHLANALGFNTRGRPTRYSVGSVGVGYGRKGKMLGFDVTIWNVEV